MELFFLPRKSPRRPNDLTHCQVFINYDAREVRRHRGFVLPSTQGIDQRQRVSGGWSTGVAGRCWVLLRHVLYFWICQRIRVSRYASFNTVDLR